MTPPALRDKAETVSLLAFSMSGKVFINYRRGPDSAAAGRLYDHLEAGLSGSKLFIDVDNIPAGQDFVTELDRQVEHCDVFLAVVGRDWLDASDSEGRRRLTNPNDFVRIEIEAALRHGKTLIPVLVDEAAMPRPEDVPKSMAPFCRRNALRLTHARFRADVQGVTATVKAALDKAEERRAAEEQARAAQERHEELARAAAIEMATQATREHVRVQAGAGLSPDDIAKAEELANWDFVKQSESEEELRDHLARFPNGVTRKMARRRVEDVVWNAAQRSEETVIIKMYLEEFVPGKYTLEAEHLLRQRESAIADRRRAEEREAREAGAWAALEGCKDPQAFRKFMRDFPKGPHFEQAWQLLSALTQGQMRR